MKYILLGLLLVLQQWVVAQVVVTPLLPPSGLVTKTQLWNFSIFNGTGSTMTIQVQVTLTDISNNQGVLVGTSKLMNLPAGTRQFGLSDISPAVFSVLNTNYGVDASPDGFLPIGRFTICYVVNKVVENITDRLTEECDIAEIEPVAPPFLITPEDSSKLETNAPLFIWSPPAPTYLYNNLRYEWKLVEVLPLQTAATAIDQNIPLLSQSNLLAPSYQYPVAGPALDTSKLYAWRITAKNNTTAIANSEVWTFRLKPYSTEAPVTPAASFYSKMRQTDDASYIVTNGKIRYHYLNEINDTKVSLQVYEISGNQRKALALEQTQQAVSLGNNYLMLDISEHIGLKDKNFYLLELTNSKGEKWVLKFECKKQ